MLTLQQYTTKTCAVCKAHRPMLTVEFDCANLPCNYGASAYPEIWFGKFDDYSLLAATFFHELGHCAVSAGSVDLKVEREINAWRFGFDLMVEHGFSVSLKQIQYCLDCLFSYAGWDIREPTTEGLLELRRRIREKNQHEDKQQEIPIKP